MSRREVEAAVRRLPPAVKPEQWKAKNYIGAGESRLEFLDLTAPIVRECAKRGFSFSGRPFAKQWKIWNTIWRTSRTFEVLTLALDFASRRPIEERHANRKTLIAWVKRSDNWAISDGLSSLYAELLEYDAAAIRPVLRKWARSKNPWERRQALVSLLYYSSQRTPEKVPSFKSLITAVDLHLEDSHYYVQKGVGWTIREIYNVYPRETTTWLLRNIVRIAAPAWQASTEKLPAATKAKLKEIRRGQTKKKK